MLGRNKASPGKMTESENERRHRCRGFKQGIGGWEGGKKSWESMEKRNPCASTCCDENAAKIGNWGHLIGALIAGGRDAVAALNQLKSR